MQYWMVGYLRRNWFTTSDSLAQIIHAFTQQVTSFYYQRDYCEKNYPDFNAHKCALSIVNFKPLNEYGLMLTNMKRMYLPDQHDDLKDGIIEYKEIDEVFEADGVLYDNVDHYTAV